MPRRWSPGYEIGSSEAAEVRDPNGRTTWPDGTTRNLRKKGHGGLALGGVRCPEWVLVRRRLGGVGTSVWPRDGARRGSDGGKIVMLDSSRMPGTQPATAAPARCDRAIVVRPTAVPSVQRPDRSVTRLSDARRHSRPYMPRTDRFGAHREQETHT